MPTYPPYLGSGIRFPETNNNQIDQQRLKLIFLPLNLAGKPVGENCPQDLPFPDLDGDESVLRSQSNMAFVGRTYPKQAPCTPPVAVYFGADLSTTKKYCLRPLETPLGTPNVPMPRMEYGEGGTLGVPIGVCRVRSSTRLHRPLVREPYRFPSVPTNRNRRPTPVCPIFWTWPFLLHDTFDHL